MQFTKIDINNWTRKEYFDHYFDNTPCTLQIPAERRSHSEMSGVPIPP